MAEARYRRELFFSEHPKCCFCGGDEPATTLDHIPPRAMFSNRQWPEGYEFPACESCNSRTRHIEQVISLYTLAADLDPTEDDLQQFGNLLRGVTNNFPELVPKPIESANDKRRFLKRIGKELSPGMTTDDLHLATLPKEVKPLFVKFLTKLLCALFYKEMKSILPLTSGISATFSSTANLKEDQVDVLTKIFANYRSTTRTQRDISRQFSYRFEVGEENRLFGAIVHLRGNIVALVAGATDQSLITTRRPNDWYDLFGDPLNLEAVSTN